MYKLAVGISIFTIKYVCGKVATLKNGSLNISMIYASKTAGCSLFIVFMLSIRLSFTVIYMYDRVDD